MAGACRPFVRQLFVGAGEVESSNQDAFERKLYVIRKSSGHAIHGINSIAFPLSACTRSSLSTTWAARSRDDNT